METLQQTLERFIKKEMKKESKRICRGFINNKSRLIIFVVSEYNCYQARKGMSKFIALPIHKRGDYTEGDISLITNADELSFDTVYSNEIADAVVKWLNEFFEQDDKAKGYRNNAGNRTRANNY